MTFEKVEYSISEVVPRVYHVEFSNRVDTALHFLRFQEYYESDCELFFRKPFFFSEYVRWYSINRGNGSFSYPSDWSGFNVPGFVFEKFYKDYFYEELSFDVNNFDRSMREIIETARKKFGLKSYDWNFYLIGTTTSNENNKTLMHEIAHGLFATSSDYRTDMLCQINSLDTNLIRDMEANLAKLGYNECVHFDEIQAYLSTGESKTVLSTDIMLNESSAADKIREFEEIYKRYTQCQKQ